MGSLFDGCDWLLDSDIAAVDVITKSLESFRIIQNEIVDPSDLSRPLYDILTGSCIITIHDGATRR